MSTRYIWPSQVEFYIYNLKYKLDHDRIFTIFLKTHNSYQDPTFVNQVMPTGSYPDWNDKHAIH